MASALPTVSDPSASVADADTPERDGAGSSVPSVESLAADIDPAEPASLAVDTSAAFADVSGALDGVSGVPADVPAGRVDASVSVGSIESDRHNSGRSSPRSTLASVTETAASGVDGGVGSGGGLSESRTSPSSVSVASVGTPAPGSSASSESSDTATASVTRRASSSGAAVVSTVRTEWACDS